MSTSSWPKAMFWAIVPLKTYGVCNTKPMRSLSSRRCSEVRSTESTAMEPAVGSRRPPMSRRRVDLPEPDRPTMATLVPGSISRLMSESIGSPSL